MRPLLAITVLALLVSTGAPVQAQDGHGDDGHHGGADPCLDDPGRERGQQAAQKEGLRVRFDYPCGVVVGRTHDYAVTFQDVRTGDPVTRGDSLSIRVEYWASERLSTDETTAELTDASAGRYTITYALTRPEGPHFFVPTGSRHAIFMLNDVEAAAGLPSLSLAGAALALVSAAWVVGRRQGHG